MASLTRLALILALGFSVPLGTFAQSTPLDTNAPKPTVVASRQLVRTFTSTMRVYAATFSADGRFAYSVHENGIVKTWNVATGAEMRTFTPPLDFHFEYAQAFSQDKRFLLLAGRRISEREEAEQRETAQPMAGQLPMRLLYVDLESGTISPGLDRLELGSLGDRFASFSSVAFGGDYIAVGIEASGDEREQESSTTGNKTQHVILVSKISSLKVVKKINLAFSSQVALSPSGDKLAIFEGDNIKVWDTSNFELLWTAKTESILSDSQAVPSLSFSSDGKRVLVAGNSGGDDAYVWTIVDNAQKEESTERLPTLYVWDASNGKLIASDGKIGYAVSAAFSKSGRFVAAGYAHAPVMNSGSGQGPGHIEIMDVHNRGHYFLKGHALDVAALAFSSDGRFVLSGSDDKTLKLWDVSEWTQPKEARR